MYKPGLLVALYSDYEDAAKKYMDARNENALAAEQLLQRMKLIAKSIEYTEKMRDGTMGKEPLSRDFSQQANQALSAAGVQA